MEDRKSMGEDRPICQGDLISGQSPEVALGCPSCGETFPVVNGIPRMISSAMRQAIGGNPPADLTQIDLALSIPSRGGVERGRRTHADEAIRRIAVSRLRQRPVRPPVGADRIPLHARRGRGMVAARRAGRDGRLAELRMALDGSQAGEIIISYFIFHMPYFICHISYGI